MAEKVHTCECAFGCGRPGTRWQRFHTWYGYSTLMRCCDRCAREQAVSTVLESRRRSLRPTPFRVRFSSIR
jgi:hypothetical protein